MRVQKIFCFLEVFVLTRFSLLAGRWPVMADSLKLLEALLIYLGKHNIKASGVQGLRLGVLKFIGENVSSKVNWEGEFVSSTKQQSSFKLNYYLGGA